MAATRGPGASRFLSTLEIHVKWPDLQRKAKGWVRKPKKQKPWNNRSPCEKHALNLSLFLACFSLDLDWAGHRGPWQSEPSRAVPVPARSAAPLRCPQRWCRDLGEQRAAPSPHCKPGLGLHPSPARTPRLLGLAQEPRARQWRCASAPAGAGEHRYGQDLFFLLKHIRLQISGGSARREPGYHHWVFPASPQPSPEANNTQFSSQHLAPLGLLSCAPSR